MRTRWLVILAALGTIAGLLARWLRHRHAETGFDAETMEQRRAA